MTALVHLFIHRLSCQFHQSTRKYHKRENRKSKVVYQRGGEEEEEEGKEQLEHFNMQVLRARPALRH